MFYYGHTYPYEPSHYPGMAAPAVPPPPPTGGINSVLEYDLNHMAAFALWCAFGMLKRPRTPSKEFEQLMVLVLFATRLPKLTIIIGLEYMNQRFHASRSTHNDSLLGHDVFVHLIVALVLANKFNDDNTFTNKLWCGATGLQLTQLNHQEAAWLAACKWNMNVVNFELNILTLEDCWRLWMESREPVVAMPPPTLPPTLVALPMSPFDAHYQATPMTPSYSSYLGAYQAYSLPQYTQYSLAYGSHNYVPTHGPLQAPFTQPMPGYVGFLLPHNYQSPVFDPVIQYAQKSIHQNPYYYNVF